MTGIQWWSSPLAGGVVPRNDEERIANGRVHQVLRLIGWRVPSLTHQEVFRLRKAGRCRTDQH